jgi:hypothetical protein
MRTYKERPLCRAIIERDGLHFDPTDHTYYRSILNREGEIIGTSPEVRKQLKKMEQEAKAPSAV